MNGAWARSPRPLAAARGQEGKEGTGSTAPGGLQGQADPEGGVCVTQGCPKLNEAFPCSSQSSRRSDDDVLEEQIKQTSEDSRALRELMEGERGKLRQSLEELQQLHSQVRSLWVQVGLKGGTLESPRYPLPPFLEALGKLDCRKLGGFPAKCRGWTRWHEKIRRVILASTEFHSSDLKCSKKVVLVDGILRS